MQMICSVYVIAGRRGARFIVVYKRTKWRTYFSPPEDLVSIVSLRNEVSLWSSLNDKERPMQLWRVLRMSVIGLHKRGTEGDRNIVGNKYVILYPAGGKREVLVCWRGFVRSFAVSLSFPNLSLESIKLERERYTQTKLEIAKQTFIVRVRAWSSKAERQTMMNIKTSTVICKQSTAVADQFATTSVSSARQLLSAYRSVVSRMVFCIPVDSFALYTLT